MVIKLDDIMHEEQECDHKVLKYNCTWPSERGITKAFDLYDCLICKSTITMRGEYKKIEESEYYVKVTK